MYQELQHKIEPQSRFRKPQFSGKDKVKAIFFGLLATVVGYVLINIITLPRVADIERFVPAGSVQIYDRYDHFVCAVENGEAREPVAFSAIPKYVRDAMVSIEDRQFYKHDGVNLMSVGRALMANLKAGKVVEGGSTITQQLAKNLFLDGADRSLTRKIKEAVLAVQLEQSYPKDRILELYLNQVYFGRRAYGIKRAARAYFNKDVERLTLSEAAFLAGLVKAPSHLGDPKNLREAVERQSAVLAAMVENGLITQAQADAAHKQKLRFQKGTTPVQKHPYFVSHVLAAVRPEFGERIDSEGLRIYTSMDSLAQRAAEKALTAGIQRAPGGVTQGALVSISVADGGVLAMVGGVGDYYKAQFNRATAPHTMGSSFKPFVYLSAFENSIVAPNTTVEDEPLTITIPGGQVYEPKNFDGKFMGPLQVRQALAFSRNTCAVRIAQATGIGRVVETAKNCGLNAHLDHHLSLALGASAASPLDMAGAYGTFARGGKVIEPWLIRRVETGDGHVLKEFGTKTWTGADPGAITQLLTCMQDAVQYGTAQLAKMGNRPVAAKTGTADQAKDLWFIGTTPDVVTAVWGGNDDNLPIGGSATGGSVMSFIWKDYMTRYYSAHSTPPGAFPTTGPLDFFFKMVPPAKPAKQEEEAVQPEQSQQPAQELVSPNEQTEDAQVEEVDPSTIAPAPAPQVQYNGNEPVQIDDHGQPVRGGQDAKWWFRGGPQPNSDQSPEPEEETEGMPPVAPNAVPTPRQAPAPTPSPQRAPQAEGSGQSSAPRTSQQEPQPAPTQPVQEEPQPAPGMQPEPLTTPVDDGPY